MIIKTLTLGELDTNCYLVWDEQSKETLVIDPSDSGDYISQVILELALEPSAIILTHGHFDHVLGLLELKLNFHDVPIFMHEADVSLIKNAQKSAMHWLKRQVDPVPTPTLFLSSDTEFSIGQYTAQVIETPGHTPGSICLFFTAPNWSTEERPKSTHATPVLFTGDLLFKDGVGRTDFSYSSPLDLESSLQSLKELPSETACFPGHGEITTLGRELHY